MVNPPPPYAGRVPPPIDPKVLRPRRIWYVIAAVIPVVIVGLGVIALVLAILYATGSRDRVFDAGSSVSVELREDTAIWFAPGGSDGHASDVSARCSVVGPGSLRVAAQVPNYSFDASDQGRTWSLGFVVDLHTPGRYTVSCTGDEGVSFAVGAVPDLLLFGGGIVGMIGSFFVGGLAAVIIVIVVAVRRSRHRDRLLAQGVAGTWNTG